MKYIKHNNTPAIELKNYPCHTLDVERCINLVSDAVRAVCGQKQLDGFIRTQLSLRQACQTLKQKLNTALNEKRYFVLLFH